MKRCPQCKTDYYDNMLDFCLEDGTKLDLIDGTFNETATIVADTNKFADRTVAFDKPAVHPTEFPETIAGEKKAYLPNAAAVKTRLTDQWIKTLETVPIVLALAHNYWQWLYLDKLRYSQFTAFIFSGSFLIWLTLLIAGTGFSLLSFKQSKNKFIAVTSLIILAINVLLYLVPRQS